MISLIEMEIMTTYELAEQLVCRLTEGEHHLLLLRMAGEYDDMETTFRWCEMCDRKTARFRTSTVFRCQYDGWPQCHAWICMWCLRNEGMERDSYMCTHHRNPILRNMALRFLKYGIHD